ncbi:MAG: F0F1 ATP synthase subunit A [Patescibacteria group bacterium]
MMEIPITETESGQFEAAAPAPEALHEATKEAAPHISLRAETLFHIGGFPVTNSFFSTFFVLLLLVVAGGFFKKRLALIPRGFQNVLESVLEGALNLMDSVLGNREKSEKYLPLIATIFFFVLLSNWFGLIPGVGSIGIREGSEFTPLFRAPSADLNFTLAVALTTIIAINLLAILALGARLHASKFFNFKNPIFFSVGILELISEFAKIISFSFRLFGNVFAGEVLLTITAFLVPYVIPLPFLFLEIFVGFIQALVFAMLALVFLATATVEHGAEAH